MRLCAACVALTALLGCAAEPPQNVEIGFRNPTVPLGGTSRFDAARFAGKWETVACLGQCEPSVTYETATDGVLLRSAGETEAPFTLSAPGVLRQMGGDETLVVMWVDEGFRTAAVGDADGTRAAILSRARRGGADRIAAAMEILDFNGWDVSQIRKVDG